ADAGGFLAHVGFRGFLLRLARPSQMSRMRTSDQAVGLFLPAIGFDGPLRVRALVWVRCPRTGRLRRCRSPRYEPISMRRLMFIEMSLRRSPSTLPSASMT